MKCLVLSVDDPRELASFITRDIFREVIYSTQLSIRGNNLRHSVGVVNT